jgi:hypothetical protein
VQLIAERAEVDPGVTDVRLPRRRSPIAAILVDTQMYCMTPASWTGQAPSSWLIAAAQWLAESPSAKFVAWINGVEFDVDRGRLAEQLAAAMSMGSAVALLAFEGRAMVRFVQCGYGQLVWSMPSPSIGDDAGWATATDELTRAGLALQPRPAWACLFADLSWSPMLPAHRPDRAVGVTVDDCLQDPRWGLPDAYPVVLLTPEWAAACGFSVSSQGSADDLVLVEVIDPRALIPQSIYVEIPRTVDHDATVRYARERLEPVLASRLREPPPTEEEIARGLARLSWRDRRYGPRSQERMAGWLAESGRALTRTTAGRGNVGIGLADLETVEACLDAWRTDPAKDRLVEEIAVFLGEVFFASLPESRWDYRSHGEPLIALRDGRQIDLRALARQRVDRGRPALPTILRDLAAR